ncbi:AbrB/MazE/SpoVT family DNA-binding domain-containing protein [Porcipelethomonas sp.]|uniref:AbrB/MazE/SpoVT family DNA-binding domain-containing protein n=1 Tax=Porcipelethomonas sp. TaxID=2981675 RepID=UPI003EF41FC2
MKDTVITKTIDDLGRIVLPKDIRKKLGMEIRSAVDVRVEDDKIIISKFHNECIFCGSQDDLTEFKDKYVCSECLKQLENE